VVLKTVKSDDASKLSNTVQEQDHDMHPEETTTNQLGLGDDEHASGSSSSMRASPIPPQQSIDIHVAEGSTTSDEQQKPAGGASIADVAAVDISEPATCAEPANHEFEEGAAVGTVFLPNNKYEEIFSLSPSGSNYIFCSYSLYIWNRWREWILTS